MLEPSISIVPERVEAVGFGEGGVGCEFEQPASKTITISTLATDSINHFLTDLCKLLSPFIFDSDGLRSASVHLIPEYRADFKSGLRLC